MTQIGFKRYSYVGPKAVLEAARGLSGSAQPSRRALGAWAAEQAEWNAGRLTLTFVVLPEGTLRVAPRRSEHVACASGREVVAAGELVLGDGAGACVLEANNLSTGYCPEPSSWSALEAALDALGVPHPEGFSAAFEFRRCTGCGERNLVKEGWFYCAVCGAALAERWNFDDPAG